MLGRVVELKPPQHPARLRRRECLVQRTGRVGGEIVHHNRDFLGLWEVDIADLSHAFGKILRRAPVCDLHLAPGPVDVQEDEEIGGAVALVFAIIALQLPGFGRDGLAHLADQLGRALVKAHHRV